VITAKTITIKIENGSILKLQYYLNISRRQITILTRANIMIMTKIKIENGSILNYLIYEINGRIETTKDVSLMIR